MVAFYIMEFHRLLNSSLKGQLECREVTRICEQVIRESFSYKCCQNQSRIPHHDRAANHCAFHLSDGPCTFYQNNFVNLIFSYLL